MSVLQIIEDTSVVEIVTEEIAVIEIISEGPQGPAGDSNLIFGEVPSGTINGANATFTTEFNFIPETVDITLNGLRQQRVTEFNTSGTQTIVLAVSPLAGEVLLVNYGREI